MIMKRNYCHYEIIDGVARITLANLLRDIHAEKNETILYDIDYTIDEDGFLLIDGMEDICMYSYEKEYLSELKYQPQREYIKNGKEVKLFGVKLKAKDEDYVKGWWRTIPTRQVSFVFKNYVIKSYDD